MCRCDEEAWERKKAEDALRAKKYEVEEDLSTLVSMAVADRPVASFFQNDRRSEKNPAALERYVRKFSRMREENIGLMLYGEAGCGKTFFAECIASALQEEGYYPWLTNLWALTAALSSKSIDQRAYLLRRIHRVDLLILDDFGAERDTRYMTEQVYEIINERYKAGRPLLVTTNLDPAVMAQEQHITARRIYERVMEMCAPVRIEGPTRRKTNAAGKMAALKGILEE